MNYDKEKDALNLVVSYMTAALTANEMAMNENMQEAIVWNKIAVEILQEMCEGEKDEIFARMNYVVAFLIPMILNHCRLTGITPSDFTKSVGFRAMKVNYRD